MKYISEDGTIYKSKKGYWMALYPMKEPLTSYMIKIKRLIDYEYVERNKLFVKKYLMNKCDNDEQYKEYKKTISLNRYYIKKNMKEEN